MSELNWTWNGEKIVTSNGSLCTAVLDEYDPTQWDDDTPATGPHSWHAIADSEAQAACDLIERIWEESA